MADFKGEDVDNCPRCNEHMREGDTLCSVCRREDELDEWPGGDGYPGVIQPHWLVNSRNRRVLTDDGRQGMDGKPGVGSTTEKMQGRVAEAIFANCYELDDSQLDEIIAWVNLYKAR